MQPAQPVLQRGQILGRGGGGCLLQANESSCVVTDDYLDVGQLRRHLATPRMTEFERPPEVEERLDVGEEGPGLLARDHVRLGRVRVASRQLEVAGPDRSRLRHLSGPAVEQSAPGHAGLVKDHGPEEFVVEVVGSGALLHHAPPQQLFDRGNGLLFRSSADGPDGVNVKAATKDRRRR